MSGAPGVPSNFVVQTGNLQNLASWGLTTGATSYIVQRSLDNVTFTTVATISGSPLATSYLDSAVTSGTQYWYQVAASNTNGTGLYTPSQAIVTCPNGEKSLSQIRLAAQQMADRVNSQFVTVQEWNDFINRSMYELYDLLITASEDYYMATPIQFQTDGTTILYPLPDGVRTFQSGVNVSQTIVGAPFYKLLGVDLGIQSANNGYVTVNKFNFIERNRFVYPNSASTIYGVFNMQYRLMGSFLEFIPTPSANQQIRVWYVPRLTLLLNDTDTTVTGISGWNEYIIARTAKYALDKEESNTDKLDAMILYLKQRIEETAVNRDIGQPDKISDTRISSTVWGWGSNYNGSGGGF